MVKLTEKQRRFADEYIKSGNATDAARLAGYKNAEASAKDNLRKPTIKSYIDGVLEEMASKRIMQASEAMELLTTIARGEMEETMYIGTSDGVITIEDKKPDINQRTTALKEILKRYPIDREGKERLLLAQADKATAEAVLAKNKADKLTQSGKVNELLQSLLDVKSGGDGSGQADV
ncbi:terminase small subunit [Enterococcus pseudoavium]|uniref:Terminase small subunit n=1 Tax=Enterococcus pseudoavium TaxID=44007 RepID=A0AAE4I5K0_9ENTE|nr:terminase small subunit [Enterococcus pseudoavium]MDT2738041.1 terminase small subunit [Enterococcus pseudoavium]